MDIDIFDFEKANIDLCTYVQNDGVCWSNAKQVNLQRYHKLVHPTQNY